MIPARPSPAAFDLAKEFETLALKAYPDPLGIWTNGYGHTLNVKEGDVCTPQQAEVWLLEDMMNAAYHLNLYGAQLTLSQPQYDAVVDAIFNVGPGVPDSFTKSVKGRDGILWLAKRADANLPVHSTLFRHLLAGEYQQAADEFPKWNHAGGVVMPGLTRRRQREREIFLGGTVVGTVNT